MVPVLEYQTEIAESKSKRSSQGSGGNDDVGPAMQFVRRSYRSACLISRSFSAPSQFLSRSVLK